MPGCELSNLRRGGGEGKTGLGGVDVAPLLGNATQAGGITRRRDWDRAFAATNEDVLRRQAPVVRRTGLEVAEEPAVRQRASRRSDPALDVPALVGLWIPRAPAVGPHRSYVRLTIDGGDRGVSIEGQDRGPAIVGVGGQPGPQVTGW